MYAELSITSNFTFLTGASHPEEYIARAAELGLSAIAIADDNSVAGIVRAHSAAREIARQVRERQAWDAAHTPIGPPRPAQIPPPPSFPVYLVPRLIPAARLVFADAPPITVLPENRTGWANLCRLISRGRLRAEKGDCELSLQDLLDHARGLQLLLWPQEMTSANPPGSPAIRDAPARPVTPKACFQHGGGRTRAPLGQAHPSVAKKKSRSESSEHVTDWNPFLPRLRDHFPDRLHLLLTPRYDGNDAARLNALAAEAATLNLPTLASASPLFHHGRRRRLADVLTAIRLRRRVERLGHAALANGERRLRSGAEMRRLFAGHEDAVERAYALSQKLSFSLDELRYEYPSEVEGGETPTQRLDRLAREGLSWRYPAGAPERVRNMLEHELTLIAKLRYEPYFLTVRDIVAFARSRKILCQGRGSAANSVVCYCLGITSVSPEIGTMVFERFVSEARDEPPDIDVDFEHERREEVIQWIYQRYGRHRAGLCATVIHYRGKRAIREVGRAMGLSEDTVAALASQLWGWGSPRGLDEARLREIGLDPTDRRMRQTLDLAREISGFPRHLSQHVGGFVITEGRLDELVPLENASMEGRTVICWDKDDIDTLGILKVDVLALGMLTCIRKAFELLRQHHGLDYNLATLPPEDPEVYQMLSSADAIGVFQVESRAQMNFLPRMRPRCFYDLVIEVAIIRPGPIQGDMVHPYIRRRNGEEQVTFPSDALGEVLGKTLGVPLFQEQAMQIAIVGAGFSPEQADRLRRSLATFKKHGNVREFKGMFLRGMAKNGYDSDFAERCFSQIEGFGSYGFPESHAASFALLVYASAWIKCHHPGLFACALLNAQPMGFYAPAQIVRDARAHGVEVRPICVNASYWDNAMEPDGRGGLALRLGFRQIRGLREEDAAWLTAARGNGYREVADLWRRAGLGPAVLARLAEADAFAGCGLTRRDALWAAKAVAGDRPLPLFAEDLGGETIVEPAAHLPQMSLGEQVVEDYVAMRLSLRAHPVALLRHRLTPGLAEAMRGGGSPDLSISAEKKRGATSKPVHPAAPRR